MCASCNVKKMAVDNEDGFYILQDMGIITLEGKRVNIATNLILEKIKSEGELKDWNIIEKQKVRQLQKQLKEFELDDIKNSILKEKNTQMERKIQLLKDSNQQLQTTKNEQDLQLKQLREQVDYLSTIHGICDKFGSYKSLQKSVEMANFFLDKKGPVRWIEIHRIYKARSWKKSTIEFHLNRLVQLNVIVVNELIRGEYWLNPDHNFYANIDRLVEFIVGEDLYKLAKKNWEKS